jgi:hypothetical protein
MSEENFNELTDEQFKIAQQFIVMTDHLHPVRRQQILEMLLVRHAGGVGESIADAFVVLDAVNKHCKQFMTNKDMLVDGNMRRLRI